MQGELRGGLRGGTVILLALPGRRLYDSRPKRPLGVAGNFDKRWSKNLSQYGTTTATKNTSSPALHRLQRPTFKETAECQRTEIGCPPEK